MKFSTQYHVASEIMAMRKRGSIPGAPPFFDCTFTSLKGGIDFFGAGIYSCFFREKLIYIGKYLGKQDAWQRGNVISMRWVKHIGTFTMRARNLGFSATAYDGIVEHYHQNQAGADSIIRDSFLSADRAVLVRETGCMTTLRRFLLASRIHAETGGDVSLEDFSFLYARIVDSGSTLEVRRRVSAAEARALQRLQPEGNTIPNASPPTRLDRPAVRECLEWALGGSQVTACASLPLSLKGSAKALPIIQAEPEDAGAEAHFLRLVEAAPEPVQHFVRRLAESIEKKPNAEVNFTNIPELRIRSYGKGAGVFRNVVTIQWQPRKNRLLMRSLLPERELKAHGLSLDHVCRKVLTNETFLTLELLERQPSKIIEAILQAHELIRRGELCGN